MNHWSSSDTQPEIFSQLLAELLKRLRLSNSANHHHDATWPICSRLGVHADLLGGLAQESGLEELTHLSRTLSDLAILGRDDPNQIPSDWSGAFVHLAEFLDLMMSGLDAGDSPSQWLTDPQWERLISWFAHLGTPFLVMDELEEILISWQNSWCDGSLKSKDEDDLQDRWIQLREFGDALFTSSSHESDASLLHWKGFKP